MSTENFSRTTFNVPSEIQVSLQNRTLFFQYREFQNILWINPLVGVSVENNLITIYDDFRIRRSRALLNTYISKLENICLGMQNPFVWELKILNKHFPIRVQTVNGNLVIANFFGRKQDIVIPLKGVQVNINKEIINFTHHDLETIGNLYVLIRQRTKVNRDRRVFWDGFYILRKYNLNDGTN